MINDHSKKINVETKKNNTINKITTTYLICSEFKLDYSYKMFKI